MFKKNNYKLIINKWSLVIFISFGVLLFFVVSQTQLLNTLLPIINHEIIMKTYYEKGFGWSITYPANMKVVSNSVENRVSDPDAIGNAVDFWVDGPTQRSGTEFHDGILITIFIANKAPGMSLEGFAIQKSSKSGLNNNSLYPVSKIEVNGINGYQFLISESGKTLSIFLPYKDRVDKVLVMYIISEGKNKSDYDALLKKMLDTFSFEE
nr:hypothetical protein [Candidatus Levybacteria bacterium]